MKIAYTRSRIRTPEDTFAPVEGPYHAELTDLLFVQMGTGADIPHWYGVVPPFDVLHEILARGYEVDEADMLFEWNGFELTPSEFDRILDLVRTHPRVGL